MVHIFSEKNYDNIKKVNIHFKNITYLNNQLTTNY